MTPVVVDCSIVVPWFFPEIGSDKAAALFKNVQEGRIQCLAPILLQAEFGNTALKKTKRGVCDIQKAGMQVALFLSMKIRFFDTTPFLSESFFVAQKFSLTVYDALYLVCAKKTHSMLATLDEELRAAAEKSLTPLYSPFA